MLRAIAVDDEEKALDRFERVMKEETRVHIVGRFADAKKALEFAKRNPLDIAFLDIEMPAMNGLDLAEALSRENPSIEVVFITAFDQYALRAFRAHAIGYLLKPLDIDEIREQVDSLVRRLQLREEVEERGFLTVRCFGQFACYPGEGTADAIHWRTAKAEELFALLVQYQGRSIPKDTIIDALWPDVEPQKALNHFRVTCTYLRGALADKGFTNVLLRERDSYAVSTERLRCDLFQFVSTVGLIASQDPDMRLLEEASSLYSPPYLGDRFYGWAAQMRTWLDNEFRRIQRRLADQYVKRGEPGRACDALAKALQQDPTDEETVERLVSLRLLAGDTTSAVKVYQEYEKRLRAELGFSPSERLQRLIQAAYET